MPPLDHALIRRGWYAPRVALAAAVAVAFTVYAILAHAAPEPRVFLDELIYLDAAGSLAEGNGLEVRGEPYGFAVLYPIVLAPLLFVFDREVAYELAKSLNALFFALAAVPIYLLARRVLQPWPSVAVAALSIAVPSAMYTSVVMTESLAYLVSCWALLAIMLAIERPSVARQGAALAAIVVAYLVRPQFLALYVAYMLSLVAVPRLGGAHWRGARRALTPLWPTIAAGAIGLGAFVLRPLVSGTSPAESFGEYSALWRGYAPLDVARYLLYEFVNLELYLAVAPMAVAPIVVAAFVREARGGARQRAAFVALFLAVNVCLFALVAAFDSVHFRYLHDRYLFYVVPLWLIALFTWFAIGAPRLRTALAIGVGFALLPGLMPLTELESYRGNWRFHALGSAFPAEVADAVGSTIGTRLVLSALGLGLVAATFLLRRKAVPLVVAAIVCMLALNGAGAWATALDPPQRSVFAGSEQDRRWVDRHVPASASVAQLYVSCEGLVPTDRWQTTTNSLLLTEFFNASVGPLFHLGGERSTSVRIGPDGAVALRSGSPLRATYVVAQPGARVLGQRLGEGTAAHLVLWRVEGAVRVAGVGSSAELRDVTCRAEL